MGAAARPPNQGLYAGVAAVVCLLVAAPLAGAPALPVLAAMMMASVVGAGLWAQLIEGSARLLRPYGYFGSVLGVGALALVLGAFDGPAAWRGFVAIGIGSTFGQAVGRVRCLVQGCCHGREAPPAIGIRYTHPRSRVVRLSTLGGVPLHATPVYSMLWTTLVGLLLLRLWSIAAPLEFIAGAYFILIGLGRFVEEHFRGEPQTAEFGGLRLYQWLSVTFVVGGAVITTLGSTAAPPREPFSATVLPWALLIGAAYWVAYGVDLPASNRRFSRLV